LTAPMVKPEMKRSRNRLNKNAIGTATRMAAAWSDCQKKKGDRVELLGQLQHCLAHVQGTRHADVRVGLPARPS
jgi:hypothetical protein